MENDDNTIEFGVLISHYFPFFYFLSLNIKKHTSKSTCQIYCFWVVLYIEIQTSFSVRCHILISNLIILTKKGTPLCEICPIQARDFTTTGVNSIWEDNCTKTDNLFKRDELNIVYSQLLAKNVTFLVVRHFEKVR